MRVTPLLAILICVGCKAGPRIVGSWSVVGNAAKETHTYRSDGTCELHSHFENPRGPFDIYFRGTYTADDKTLTITLTKSHSEGNSGRIRDRDLTPRPEKIDLIWIDNDHVRASDAGPMPGSYDYTRIKP